MASEGRKYQTRQFHSYGCRYSLSRETLLIPVKGTNRTQLWENNLGSWRAHMNAIRAVIENRLSSALIMEDDVDWDVNIKSQLSIFAPGARQIADTSSSPVPDSPYGSEWDVLWLGHCGEHFPEMVEPKLDNPDVRKYIIENDATVPGFGPETPKGFIRWREYPEHSRFVHRTGAPICTYAYALSYKGAQKLLYALSVDGLRGPFDNSLSDLCRYQFHGVNCVSVTPPFFSHHKSKGYMSGDSDIQRYGGGGEVREKGETENIVYSARLNIEQMLKGEEPVAQ